VIPGEGGMLLLAGRVSLVSWAASKRGSQHSTLRSVGKVGSYQQQLRTVLHNTPLSQHKNKFEKKCLQIRK